MREYNMDESYPNFPNQFIHHTIKRSIANDTLFDNTNIPTVMARPYLQAHMLRMITDGDLLENTIKLLKGGGWFIKEKYANELLANELTTNNIYSHEDAVKIKAIVFSALMEYEILIKFNTHVINNRIPNFLFLLEGRTIKVNNDDLYQFVINEHNKLLINRVDSLGTIFEKREELKAIVYNMAMVDTEHGTTTFKSQKENFTYLKDNLPSDENKSCNAKHLHIFKNNGFIIFDHIMKNYVREKGKRGRYNDVSYYCRKLSQDNEYIHVKIEPFKKWFNELYQDKLDKITMANFTDEARDRNFKTSLDWFKQLN